MRDCSAGTARVQTWVSQDKAPWDGDNSLSHGGVVTVSSFGKLLFKPFVFLCPGCFQAKLKFMYKGLLGCHSFILSANTYQMHLYCCS